MALARMKKLTLIGMISDKENILDAVVSTGSLQLEDATELSYSAEDSDNYERLTTQLTRISDTINIIKAETQRHNAGQKDGTQKVQLPKRSMARPFFEINFEDFNVLGEKSSDIFSKIDSVEQAQRKLSACNSRRAKAQSEIASLALYSALPHPLGYYKDTETTAILLGVLPSASLNNITSAMQDIPLSEMEIIQGGSSSVIVVAVHKSAEREITDLLTAGGFTKPSFESDIVPALRIEQLKGELKAIAIEEQSLRAGIAEHAGIISELELFYDYIELQVKKAVASGSFKTTEKTFLLRGFYPERSEELLLKAINDSTGYVLTYLDEVSEEEDVPVLYQNKGFFRSFEPVTDMYTPPSYRELDPNPVMSIFYLIIFGLMVADMGYGLILCLFGLLATVCIKQETSTRRLAKLFGLCGIGAIAVGALYGSAFSYTLYKGLIPDASTYPKTTMMICILFGILHLSAGVLMNSAKEFRRKNYVIAFGVSFAWGLFFIGVFMFVLQPAISFMDYPSFATTKIPSLVSQIGLIIAGGSLLSAMLCSGHGKSVGGRLASAFSSVYGILNYFSDAMSYIRIFGLMLSSAMMGVVINMLADMVFATGVLGIVPGIILLVFAHLFNLAIGVLGVYIHDGRLQYMEFFGKFYEGDGRLFAPFGSDMKYTLLRRKNTSLTADNV